MLGVLFYPASVWREYPSRTRSRSGRGAAVHRAAQDTAQTRAPLYGPLRILLPTDLSTKISLHIAFDIGDIRLGRLPDIEAASS